MPGTHSRNFMPVVTSLYAGLTFLLVAALGANVTRVRVKAKAFVGVPPENLLTEIRAHGNAAEWVPVLMGLLLLLELTGLPSMQLHILGGTAFLARVMHAAGFLGKSNGLGAGASMLNYVMCFTMSIWLLVRHFSM
jgi:uncharacterized protein